MFKQEREKRDVAVPKINAAAVSRVISDHLFNVDDSAPESRALRHKVERALHGTTLTPQTLEWFIDAFRLTEEHSEALISARNTADRQAPESADPKRPYRVRSLQEFHYLGADGLPERHQSTYVIEAIKDGVSCHVCVFDTPELTVTAPYCDIGPIVVSPERPGFWQCDINFRTPLKVGQIKSFTFNIEFSYSEPPPRELRRGASVSSLFALALTVHFHPAKVPSSIALSEWSSYTATKIDKQIPATLDDDYICHHFEQELTNRLVGFTWEW